MMDWLADNPQVVLSVVKTALALFVMLNAVAYVVLFERNVVANMQSSWGPHRVGPHGLLQPLADGLKFIFKEDIVFAGVTSKLVYLLAPFLSDSLALMAIAVIPVGPERISILGTDTGL